VQFNFFCAKNTSFNLAEKSYRREDMRNF